MKKSLKISICAAVVCMIAALSVWAYAITYITYAATFTGHTVTFAPPGISGSNVTVTDQICPGDTIVFDATFGVGGNMGGTMLPRSAVFDVTTSIKPPGASDVGYSGMPQTHTFATVNSSFTDHIILTAPSTLGAYQIILTGEDTNNGNGHITSGGGLKVNFTVSDCSSSCEQISTALTVTNACVVLHNQNPATLSATLKDASNNPLSGQTLHFSVPDGGFTMDATTDGSGVASVSYDASGLSVGDHSVNVTYDGTPCADGIQYLGTTGSDSIGVTYLFLGFQQPINADGSSVFKGGVVAIKIKITDYNGVSVPDAQPHVFYGGETSYPVGTDAEPLANTNGDSGNLMRYDPTAQQYVFNWDIGATAITNGTYQIWVDLAEGACANPHTVTLSINKVGRGHR